MRKSNLLPKSVRLVAKKTYHFLQIMRWTHHQRGSGGVASRVHILVVKSGSYVPVAKVAVFSFLYWNPKSEIFVHCDSNTSNALRYEFRNLITANKVTIQQDMDDSKPWQVSKMQLVLSINNSKDIYMDADMRWNAPCPIITNPLFYVYEFKFAEHREFSALYSQLLSTNWPNSSMSNTSFVTFNGQNINQESISRVIVLHDQIINWAEQFPDENENKKQIMRLAEQIALSVILEDSLEFKYLKSSDSRLDGQFVETSYFGATGLSF